MSDPTPGANVSPDVDHALRQVAQTLCRRFDHRVDHRDPAHLRVVLRQPARQGPADRQSDEDDRVAPLLQVAKGIFCRARPVRPALVQDVARVGAVPRKQWQVDRHTL